MLTQEENDLLTRVGPGTPGGDLLRRYWHPVAVARELTVEQPTMHVRLLGEDLVLFKDKSGRVGLVADHCAHRGASLLYGRVEERGIACAYHGWLYDTEGNCLECPAEPAGSNFYLTVKTQAYPVQEFAGLYWAYLGPAPAPVIPNYDLWVRKNGRRRVFVLPLLDCNWFQTMENAADPAHADILHGETIKRRGTTPGSSTRGVVDQVVKYEFNPISYGIMKKRTFNNGSWSEHPLIFPNIVRQGDVTQIRVPIDDEHTWHVWVCYEPSEDGSQVDEEGEEIRADYVVQFKDPIGAIHPSAHMRMDMVLAQDHMAWETQGLIADRAKERLATSDQGIAMLRELMFENIAKVQRGIDPLGVVRDPNHATIDTNLDHELSYQRSRTNRGFELVSS